MAGLTVDEVFGRIECIAHSLESLDGRRMRAETRIDQFIVDLAKANLQPRGAEIIVYQLKAKLESTASDRTAGGVDQVFRAALERLPLEQC